MKNYPSATVACFDPTIGELPRRQLDRSRLEQFLARLSAAGVPAVLIAASTGHGHLRTPGELEAFLEAAAVVDLGETRKMALLRPEDGAAFNRQLLGRLKDWGYDVVFFRPGNDLPADAGDDRVAQQLSPLIAVAHDLGLPVGLYSIPDVSGLPLSANAVAELTRAPGGDSIVAVKVTEANYEQSTLTFFRHPDLTHLQIVQGWDPHLARALQDGKGRCGVTSGPMSLAVFQYLHIFDAAAGNDWSEVAAAQQAVTALFESMQDDPTKFADLQRAKYIMGLGHPITAEVTADQVERVMSALRKLPRAEDRQRLARSLDLMEDGPFHDDLLALTTG